jgi:NTF2 fold immunity protein
MKLRRVPIWAVVLVAVAQAQTYAPTKGFVPDGSTAARIAEAILIPVYGKEEVDSGFAFKAIQEKQGVWTIGWDLGCPEAMSETCLGGQVEVKIRQVDGRILKVIHHD